MVPWVIAAFYLTFMSTLIAFVVIAYRHPPSDVTAEAYEKGLDYNATIGKGEAQAQLGWTSSLTIEGGRLVFSLKDAAGRALDDGVARAWFVRPDSAAFDRAVDLTAIGNGRYSAPLSLPVAGLWQVHVTAEVKGQQYQRVEAMEID